jgi:hypothetical protein
VTLSGMQLARLQELLGTFTPGKGWDKASLRLGYARGCGLSLKDAQAFANETTYPLMSDGVNVETGRDRP